MCAIVCAHLRCVWRAAPQVWKFCVRVVFMQDPRPVSCCRSDCVERGFGGHEEEEVSEKALVVKDFRKTHHVD